MTFKYNHGRLENEDTFDVIKSHFIKYIISDKIDVIIIRICSIRKHFVVHQNSDVLYAYLVDVTHWPNCGKANVNGT